MMRTAAGAFVAVALVASQTLSDPSPALPADKGSSRAWLWVGGAVVGAAGLAGVAALAYFMKRSFDARAATHPPGLPLAVHDRPPPTQPGEPAMANPFAVLPETRLVIVRGLPAEDRFYRIATSPFLVGADPANQLVVDAPHVSAHHATIELLADGTVYLLDASRNGTYIDGTRVPPGERVRVIPGQRISFSRDVEVRLEQPSRATGDVALARPAASAQLANPAEPNPARKPETVIAQPKPWREDR